MCFISEKAEIKKPNTFHTIIHFHYWPRNFKNKKYSSRQKYSSMRKNVLKNVSGKSSGDVTELCRAQNYIWGMILVLPLSYPSRTVCACAAKLADRNFSKECIKWNHN